jgi:ADP-ribosylglycohydrolase
MKQAMGALMLGAMIGDIIGSPYEFNNIHTTEFPLFSDKCKTTDDTVCTAAVAWKLVHGGAYESRLVELGQRYYDKGWGKKFADWINDEQRKPYSSWGNGAAMRVSPIGWWHSDLQSVLTEAKESCLCSHNHEDSYTAAQAVAGSIFKLRTGSSKDEVRTWVAEQFGYDLTRKLDDIRPTFKFEVSCAKSVPEAIIAFLEGNSFEEVARLAVSLGGDSDTICAIACSLAEAYFEVPTTILVDASRFIEPEIIHIWTEYTEAVIRRQA